MVTKLIMACILSATLLSCNGQNTNTINYATVEPLHINRFDKDLFRLIDTGDTTLQPELIKQYPEMLDIIGKGILNLQTIETPGFFEKMRNYYSEPTLKGLYREILGVRIRLSKGEFPLDADPCYLYACIWFQPERIGRR